MSDDILSPVPRHRVRALTSAAREYGRQLFQDDAALAFWRDRGLTDDTIRDAGLGYARVPVAGHEKYRGMLSIPYWVHGGVVTIRWRRLGDGWGGPKYLSMPDEPARLYGTDVLSDPAAVEVFACEGEGDRLVLSQLGLAAVAFPGAQTLKPWMRTALRDRQVFIVTDPDAAGDQLAEQLSGLGPRVHLPGDVTETFQAGGKGAILEALAEALMVQEAHIDDYLTGGDD